MVQRVGVVVPLGPVLFLFIQFLKMYLFPSLQLTIMHILRQWEETGDEPLVLMQTPHRRGRDGPRSSDLDAKTKCLLSLNADLYSLR